MSERPSQDNSTPTTNIDTSNVSSSYASAQLPAGSAFAQGQQRQPTPLSVQPRDLPASSSRGVTSQPASAQSATSRELPPPPRPSRSASFSNILNPDDGTQSRRRKATYLDSPVSSATSFRHGRQSPALPGPSAYSDHPSQPRRILTPRSPSLHRAASMGQLNGPTGTIDAQQSPFLTTRTYTAGPGAAGVPPMPPSRGYIPPPSPSIIDRRTSGSTAHDFKARSPSVSPRTSYARHYSSMRSSPSSTLPSLSTMPYNMDMGMSNRQRMTIPISSAAGQNVYQMMTLQTSSGTVQVPVDVQAASRVADEKRRRNAGASARFRARRKEKEKESTTTISKLEMQVKHLQEDVDFYRRERGYLAGVVLQIPGGDRHFPRPQSPRHRRVSIGFEASTSGSVDYMSGHEMSHSPRERNVRRRTSTISMPVGVHMSAGPSYAPQHYEPQQYHQQGPPLPGPSSLLPPMHGHPPAPAHNTSLPAPSPRTAWHPYNEQRPSDPHGR